MAADGFGEVGEAFGPGEHGFVGVAAGGKVVQAGEGGYLGDALAVVVAAAVVEIPEQAGGAVVFFFEPDGEGGLVEAAPFFVGGGMGDGDGEDFAPVAAVCAAQGFDEGVEAAAVGIFLWQQGILPAVLVIQALGGGVNQIDFAIQGLGLIDAVEQDAEVG